jgi:hypothetical protein
MNSNPLLGGRGSFSLKQALLLSSQSKASLTIELPWDAPDYKLVASCVSDMHDESANVYELNIHTMQERRITPVPHKSLHFTGRDTLIAFIADHGFVVEDGWTAEEVVG